VIWLITKLVKFYLALSNLDVKTLNVAIIALFILVVIIFVASCQDMRQMKSQLPNPVRDFIEKDPYIIGLRWYEYGEYDIAHKYWEPLAKDGDCDAEFSMGLLYFEGRAVTKSYEKGRQWWTKAADKGQPQARISLGVMYSHTEIPYSLFQCRRGCGVNRDLIAAYKWFVLAGDSTSPREQNQAKKLLEKIKPEMTPEQISAAEGLIKKWRPDPSLCIPRRDL
jgi:hypothetical protein